MKKGGVCVCGGSGGGEGGAEGGWGAGDCLRETVLGKGFQIIFSPCWARS